MKTVFGSLEAYQKGNIVVIDDDPKNYVFSNIYETAARSAPYERVCSAKNFEYVIEVSRAEGQSGWYACAHDEFVVCMDGEVEVHLVKLDAPHAAIDMTIEGAQWLDDLPQGQRMMGRIVLRRGHMALLPAGAAYRFESAKPGVIMFQTIQGPATVEKWADICLA
jgi:hypothetical protein